MKHLVIAILSLVLFFILYIALHPLLGANWSAGIAAFMLYIGFPILFLRHMKSQWKGTFIKSCNYIIASIVLFFTLWFLYAAIFENKADTVNAIKAFSIYGFSALYYLVVGRFPIDVSNENAHNK